MQPLSPPPDPRSQAVAKLRRAASTRNADTSSSPFSDLNPVTSLASSLPPSAMNSTLERSTSLLARSLAMAKLTGEPIVNNTHAPPSLEALRARAGLKRNNTVTGVGVAFSTLVGAGSAPSSPDPSFASAARQATMDNQPLDRAAARVNLMRKLSSRRLVAGNGASTSRAKEEGAAESLEEIRLPAPGLLSVVGRRGKQRPRSGSMGDMDLWKTVGLQQAGPRNSEDTTTSTASSSAGIEDTGTERSWTSQSIRSSGHWAAERDRHSVIARANGDDDAWELEDAEQRSPRQKGSVSSHHGHRGKEEGEAETIRDSVAGTASSPMRPFAFGQSTPNANHTSAAMGTTEDDMATPRPSSSFNRSGAAHSRSLSTNSGVFADPPPEREEDNDEGDFAYSYHPGPASSNTPAIHLLSSSPLPSALGGATFASSPFSHDPSFSPPGSPPHLRTTRSPSDSSTTSTSSTNGSSSPTSPQRSSTAPVDQRRRNSIPSHLRHTPSHGHSQSHHQSASFGIGAVEDYEVRRRGSSASSSVAFLEARNGPGRSSDGSLHHATGNHQHGYGNAHSAGRNGSFGGQSSLGVHSHPSHDNIRLVDLLGRKESFVPGEEGEEILGASSKVPLVPHTVLKTQVERDEEEKAWEAKQELLERKVERKRELALERAAMASGQGAKSGAFPPPEVGYTFPSPTVGSPRISQDMARGVGSGHSGASGDSDESFVIVNSPHDTEAPHSLFEKRSPAVPSAPFFQNLASDPASRPPHVIPGGAASRRADSPIFNASYVPLSLPAALGGTVSTNASSVDPHLVSPTETSPPSPMTASSDMLMASAVNVDAAEMRRTASAESSKSGRKMWDFLGSSSNKGKGKKGREREISSPKFADALAPASTEMGKSLSMESAVTVPGSPAPSNYSSSTEMKRNLSGDSNDSFVLPAARHQRLPEDQLPGSKILAKLESIIGTAEIDTNQPSVLDNPPRRLLLHTPVLQVVNAQTVKDRHLFLFNDLLLIAKPIIEDHPETGDPIPSTVENYFVTKSIVELQQLRLNSVETPVEESHRNSTKKHPLLVAFVDRFANDPKRAIASLIQKGGLVNDAPTIANLLFKNTDLSRSQVGAYLSTTDNRHILCAFIQRFRFAGVRIDDALRVFLMTLRLPHTLRQAEYVLGVLAHQWTDVNTATGFDPSLTTSLVLAIMRLSETLHGPGEYGETPMYSTGGGASVSVDDFVASFRECDTRLLVQEDLLTRIYNSVRRERIEQASDNSMFSMTPDIEATIEPAKLPSLLTYRNPSELITITIPAADPKFYIKLHGTDLKFDPPTLTFAKSNTQSFRVTGTALGVRVMVLVKMGANAPRYQGLPLNKAFSIERAFMQHCFVLSFVNHLDVKRKYMFSTLNADVRSTWVRNLKDGIAASAKAPQPATKALQAGEAVAIQVLRDALIAPEAPAPTVPAPVVLPSPRPGTAVRFGTPSGVPPRTRMGTPTRAGGGALVRTNSFSRTYAAGVGKVEMDLVDRKTQNTSSQARRGSRDDPLVAPFAKKGTDLQMVVEQNSLLPLVLSFLNAGASVAPHPVSINGSAFQLPPLPTTSYLHHGQNAH